MNKNTPKNYLAFALLVGVVAISCLQVFHADAMTKTESALINILLFIFSVGFSWIISSYFSELSFLDSQKKFAIGAFRRIKEIERAISRAQHLLTSDKSESDGRSEHNHEAVMVSLLSAQDAVNSSIADWGDIIGDEIHLTKEIERLKSQRKSADKFEREYLDNLRIVHGNSGEISRRINELKSELPTSLRVEEHDDANDYFLAEKLIKDELEESGEISLSGLWEQNDSFTGDLTGVSPGDTLYIAKGFTEHRPNVLLVFDNNSNWVGLITNKFVEELEGVRIGYDDFVEIFELIIGHQLIPKQFGGNPLPIKITKIYETDANGYQHFEATLSSADIPNALSNNTRPINS